MNGPAAASDVAGNVTPVPLLCSAFRLREGNRGGGMGSPIHPEGGRVANQIKEQESGSALYGAVSIGVSVSRQPIADVGGKHEAAAAAFAAGVMPSKAPAVLASDSTGRDETP